MVWIGSRGVVSSFYLILTDLGELWHRVGEVECQVVRESLIGMQSYMHKHYCDWNQELNKGVEK